MYYGNYSFLMPGDTLKAKEESKYFHKGFTYQVSSR